LLLNVPPDRTGQLPEEHVETLMALKELIDNPPPEPVSQGRAAKASNVYKGQAPYGAHAAVDGVAATRWATDDGITSAWLEVDLGDLRTVNRAVIMAAYPELDRNRAFRIEYREGDAWRIAHQGGRIGAHQEVTFPRVTARHFRLHITEATDGPTLWEFQLFE
jgi:alpha-L-fucosidase